MAGYRYNEDWTISNYEAWYRSSSPMGSWEPNEAKAIILSQYSVWEGRYSYRTYWYSIRCFKNKYETTQTINNKISNNQNNTISSDYNNWYSKEMNDAYEYAHNNWITTINSIEKAKMNSPLTRIAMAKMLSYFAINVLGQKPDTSKWTPIFNDVTNNLNKQYNNAVTLSYQLWIMWQNIKNNNFRPNDKVTRAEFATSLSRLLFSTPDGQPYYTTHLKKLKQEWILTIDDPKIIEKRWYIMLMLMRTSN